MLPFDTYISRKLPLVSLISAVFIIYPNIAWPALGYKISGGPKLHRLLLVFCLPILFLLGVDLSVDTL